jgi:cell division protein ZapA (FtsZ GTPase activity inhibitor)
MPATVELKLLGQKLVLRPSETDPELIKEVIELVTKKVTEAESRTKTAAAHQIALLALLDLAEEYCKAKRRTRDYQRDVEDKTGKLLSLVEAEFK